jgi:hypothetical protein
MTSSMEITPPEIRIVTNLGASCSGKDYVGDIIAQMLGTTKLTISDILRIRAREE